MSTGFDKISFFQDIITDSLTINEIVAKYAVSPNTARTWVKSPLVKKIPGSYPYRYTHKDNDSISPMGGLHGTSVDLSKYYPKFDVSDEQLDTFIDATKNGPDNWKKEMFISIVDAKSTGTAKSALLSMIQAVERYYEDRIKD